MEKLNTYVEVFVQIVHLAFLAHKKQVFFNAFLVVNRERLVVAGVLRSNEADKLFGNAVRCMRRKAAVKARLRELQYELFTLCQDAGCRQRIQPDELDEGMVV